VNLVNITKVGGESNYRLLREPIQLSMVRVVVPTVDECRWEDDGGPSIELVSAETVEQRHRRMMQVRGARKQKAARAMRPVESARIVKIAKAAPMEVVAVRLEGGSDEDERIAALEAKVKELLGIVRCRKEAEEKRAGAIQQFEELFNERRMR
jgi:hypothetical protein